MSSSKQLIRETLRRRPVVRWPFVPWTGAFAARAAGVTPREMFDSPTALTAAMEGTCRLCGADAIVTPYDLTLIAEACGAEVTWLRDEEVALAEPPRPGLRLSEIDATAVTGRGRLGALIEATARLSRVVRKDLAVVAVVTGPFTLAQQLGGVDFAQALVEGDTRSAEELAAAGKIVLQVASRFAERAAIDALAVVEAVRSRELEPVFEKMLPVWRPLFQVSRFYSAPPLLVIHGEPTDADLLSRSGASGTVASWSEPASAVRQYRDHQMVVGVALSRDALGGAPEVLDRELGKLAGLQGIGGVFLTTDGAVPVETPVELVRGIAERIRGSSDE